MSRRRFIWPLTAVLVGLVLVPQIAFAVPGSFSSSSSTPGLTAANTFAGAGAKGVYGFASANTPNTTYGVYGRSNSTTARGVVGLASNPASGTKYGVYGQAFGNGGRGVFGVASGATGFTYGVVGQAVSPAGTGVYGIHTNAAGSTPGVWGVTNSTTPTAFGVFGDVTPTTSGAATAGVRGVNRGTSGALSYGVWGTHEGSGYGVYGQSVSGRGVDGISTSGIGVYGTGAAYGVYSNGDLGLGGGGNLVCGGCVGRSDTNFIHSAVVNSDGTLARGDATSSGGSTGNYTVTFAGVDITNCVYVATLGLAGDVSTEVPGSVSTVRSFGTTDTVFVNTTDLGGSNAARGFHLMVICP